MEPADTPVTPTPTPPTRRSLTFDQEEVVETVLKWYDQDLQDRLDWSDRRLQRYAKMRGWLEPKTYPWPDACFTLDTEILTEENGWQPIGDVKIGDSVYTMDADGFATYAPVTNTIHEWTDQLVYFSGKSVDLCVTPNHRMLVKRSGRYKFARADSFVGKQNAGHIPLTSKWKGDEPAAIYGFDPMAYVRFLGWYLSEGHACYDTRKDRLRGTSSLFISQSASVNPEKCRIIENDITALGTTFKKSDRGYTVHVRSLYGPFCDELRSLGTAEWKYIPSHVLNLSPRLLEPLLETLLLGDGWVKKRNGHRTYSTISPFLADDVQILAQRIGCRATIVKRMPRDGGKIRGRQITGVHPIYLVSINKKQQAKIQSLARNLIECSRAVACVEVPPHHTLYVRRNGIASWCGNSNVYLPLMMTDSLQMQDTLHNGVMSQRPVMNPQPFNPADKEKAKTVAELLDYQFFMEQQGEEKLATLAQSFVDDGTMYSLQAWIKDEQDTEHVETFPPLDPTVPIDFQLRTRIEGLFSDEKAPAIVEGSTPWSWDVKWFDENQQKQTATVEFYTNDDGRLLCVVKRTQIIFDGPAVQPKTEEDIVYPSRAENLQPPSPSNPAGAHHVALIDYPSKDEILRLIRNKYYDLPDKDAKKRLEDEESSPKGRDSADDPEQHKIQRDALAGQTYGNSDISGETFTRLMVFARWDVDGDGLDENVVFWILKEHNLLLRARLMQEMFPSREGRRPLMSEQFIPVPGQIRGIGLLELLEQIQDSMKILVDQTIDKNTLVNNPFFFFRAASGIRPEVITTSPGSGYPTANPREDVVFPVIPNAEQTMSLNLLALFQQWAERQAVIGELQFGRVPQGKASALRTTAGMMSVLQQGAARPERIIRRFFMGLSEIWTQMHELNTIYLPPKKQYRVLGMAIPGADPYRTLDDPSKIKGRFQFEFKANSLNTNKAVKGQILQQLGAMTFNPMTMQMGLVTPDNYYNWLKDIYAESGQDPNSYLNPPTPQSAMPKITAEAAMGCLLNGVIPEHLPAEGPQMHLHRLQQLLPQLRQEGAADPAFLLLYQTYIAKVQSYAVQAQQLAQAAGQFSSMLSGQGGGQAQQQPGDAQAGSQMTQQPPGQLNDESLPGAGGGANNSFMGMMG